MTAFDINQQFIYFSAALVAHDCIICYVDFTRSRFFCRDQSNVSPYFLYCHTDVLYLGCAKYYDCWTIDTNCDGGIETHQVIACSLVHSQNAAKDQAFGHYC